MLPQWIRLFKSTSGVLTDHSIAGQNSDTIPFAMVSATEYLYVGQYFPFNNLFFELGTVSTNSSDALVQYYTGKQWTDAVDIIDGTKVSGKSLNRSGVIQWSPDRHNSWQAIVDTSEGQSAVELASLKVYDLYWARLKWSADLSAGTILSNIDYAFCTSAMLSAIDPEIDNYLASWPNSGTKLNWDEQIKLASQYVVFDLKSRGLIVSVGNVLRFDDVALPTAHRCLAHIYSVLGGPFKERSIEILNVYNALMSSKRFSFDIDLDGRLDAKEISNSVGKLVR